jgi:hypothetical protein
MRTRAAALGGIISGRSPAGWAQEAASRASTLEERLAALENEARAGRNHINSKALKCFISLKTYSHSPIRWQPVSPMWGGIRSLAARMHPVPHDLNFQQKRRGVEVIWHWRMLVRVPSSTPSGQVAVAMRMVKRYSWPSVRGSDCQGQQESLQRRRRPIGRWSTQEQEGA